MINPIGLVFFLLSLAIARIFRIKFDQYAKVPLQNGLSGAAIAAKMLREHGIQDVEITCIQGALTDHYNPLTKTISLSEAVYYGNHAAAAAVAAHECGHAVQHAKGYAFLEVRSALVPVLNATARHLYWIVFMGIVCLHITPLPLQIGIGLFSLTTLFAFVTLPVEWDASSRALAWIEGYRVVTSQEYQMAKSALRWASMTYVVVALGSLAELIRLLAILRNKN